MVFLFILTAQIGTHLVIDLHDHYDTGLVHSTGPETQDHNCDLQFVCSEESDNERPVPTANDENHHFHILLTTVAIGFPSERVVSQAVSSLSVSAPDRLFDPPHLPPKIS